MHFVDHEVFESEKEVGPSSVMGKHPEMEHIRIGQDDVGVASCPGTVFLGGISIVRGRYQPRDSQAGQAAQLILRKGFGGEDEEGCGPRVFEYRFGDGYLIAE